MSLAIPSWSDLWADPHRRRGFFDYWRGMTADDWRDLIAIAILRRLPIDWASGVGGASGSVRGPRVYRWADGYARANLARLRPDLAEETRERMLAERWRCVGRTMAEFSVSDRLIAKGRVDLSGQEHLAAAHARGRGVVIPALHLGNWEVFAAVHKPGFRISSFYQPRPTRGREHISQASRQRLGYNMLKPGPAGVRDALKTLQGGEAVVIFVDEEVDSVVRGPLFGRAPRRGGNLAYAARLAQRSGAAVVPGYVLRSQGAWHCVHFAPEVVLPASLEGAVAAINAAVEPVVLAHLDQWYHLHEQLTDTPPADRL